MLCCRTSPRWVSITPEIGGRTFSRDPAHDKFLHTALSAQPAWLGTSDNDLVVLAKKMAPEGVTIVSPAAALTLPAFSGSV